MSGSAATTPVLLPAAGLILGGSGTDRSSWAGAGPEPIRLRAGDRDRQRRHARGHPHVHADGDAPGLRPVAIALPDGGASGVRGRPGSSACGLRHGVAPTTSSNTGRTSRPTNTWILATNVTDRGGGLYEVDTGPPQARHGFYRVKGLRLADGWPDSPAFAWTKEPRPAR